MAWGTRIVYICHTVGQKRSKRVAFLADAYGDPWKYLTQEELDARDTPDDNKIAVDRLADPVAVGDPKIVAPKKPRVAFNMNMVVAADL